MADSARRANESPRSGIILNSKGKLAAENKQEGAKLSSFAPSEQVTQSAPAVIQSYERLFSSSNSSNIVEQPQSLLVSESRMIRRNLFPSIPIPTQQTTRIINAELGWRINNVAFTLFYRVFFHNIRSLGRQSC